MAVYTQLTNEAIGQVLEADYGLPPLSFAVGIAQGVQNSNYLVVTKDKAGNETKYILTLYEKRVLADDVPFFLSLMQHVAQHGIACPLPLTRKDGKLWGEVAGRPSALVGFLEGKSRAILREAHVAATGEALAKLHAVAADFKGERANALSLEGWQSMFEKLRGKFDGIQGGLEKLVGDELQFLEKHWPRTLPTGIIHADLFPDNVFFLGDRVSGLIDFYFACRDALAYDVAVTLNAWCFEPNREINLTKVQALLENYQKQRPLGGDEKEAFPVLLRGAAMRFLLTRATDWVFRQEGALVTPKDPLEYVAKLKFHQQNKSAFV